MSPTTGGAPVPSTRVPPRTRRSIASVMFCSLLIFMGDLQVWAAARHSRPIFTYFLVPNCRSHPRIDSGRREPDRFFVLLIEHIIDRKN